MPTGESAENLDNLILKLQNDVLVKFGFDPGERHMEKALRLESLDHFFDPVLDYLDGLQWDGQPRLDRWLVTYCGAPDTPLVRAMGRKWMIAAVRRVRVPGCKFDFMLVFEGPQGQGKSSMLVILAGGQENYSDAELLGTRKQEQQELTEGVWIYECAELEGMRWSDVNKVKLLISKQVDSARPAYGRGRVDRPRRCVLAGTTNDDEYLRDTTGNRRFWPVKVGKIDLEAIKRDRDQLWAEAAAAEAGGEALTIPPELWAAATVEQQARQHHDIWEDPLRERLAAWMDSVRERRAKLIAKEGAKKGAEKANEDGRIALVPDEAGGLEWRVSSTWIARDLLSLPVERQGKSTTSRIADVMRMLGWTKPGSTIRVGKADACRATC
jgi:putative DNA primase/helicase